MTGEGEAAVAPTAVPETVPGQETRAAPVELVATLWRNFLREKFALDMIVLRVGMGVILARLDPAFRRREVPGAGRTGIVLGCSPRFGMQRAVRPHDAER